MLRTFTVEDWNDLNEQATRFGEENRYKSWDYEGYLAGTNDNPSGKVTVTFYPIEGMGHFVC